MKKRYILITLLCLTSCAKPKIGQTLEICWDCNHSNGVVYYKGKPYQVNHNSFNQSYFEYHKQKIFLAKQH